MKTQLVFRVLRWRNIAGIAVSFLSAQCLCFANVPHIDTISTDGTSAFVQVRVPAGFQRITLESRSRFGEGTWSPLAVAQIQGSATNLSFRVPCSRQAELMRVRADARQALPGSFYQGSSSFGASLASVSSAGPAGGGAVVNGGTSPTDGDPTRAVVESDIWKLEGNRLYFFNQYRGLQVIDISTPDAARVSGTLELPATGEQMYLPDPGHVLLLANGGCGYGTDQGQLIVLNVSNDVPVVVTNLALGGWVQDSRLVGTALYVASQNYRPMPGTTNLWEWGSAVTSFDLADPEHPQPRGALWFPGYGNVVSANDTYLFVVTQNPTNWWQSSIQIIDITAPDGTMVPFTSVITSGRVPDKFKLNYTNSVFTTISEDWRWNTSQGPITRLETFSLPDPRSLGPQGIVKLGELELGSGEQLHATRFDGELVYVVTFFQVDPLWVVDLSNPMWPHIAGSVNVPGWSSYIVPQGDRLVTVGLESHRVAVSLFDVHDSAQPALLSRLLLGENYSWSESTEDEKAFTVLSDQGLVLVPYNGDTTNGWTSAVQLIDLSRTNLVARGIVHHQSQPRRTAFSHDRILSLSGWELLSVDASDRDHPLVKGDTQLAWPVDRVFVVGDYLLELAASSQFLGYQAAATLRVTPLAQPDKMLNQLVLDGPSIVGAALKHGRLYVAQSLVYTYLVSPAGPAGSANDDTNVPNFFVSVLDISHLPNVSLLGQTSLRLDSAGWGGNWSALWPKSDVLVWAGGGNSWGWILPLGTGPITAANGAVFPWWGFSNGGELVAFDVSDPAAPAPISEVNLATNSWWGFSQPFLNDTRVYLSHNQSDLETNAAYPDGVWVQFSLLDVIDYADPHHPTVRPPVSLSGTLQGIAQQGELLYTMGSHWDTNQITDWTQWLDASAYDGVAAHLVASLALPVYWPHPILVLNTNLFIGHSGYSPDPGNLGASTLETWSLSDTGKFMLNASLDLAQPANTLTEHNGLLVVQETDNSLDLFDYSAPAGPALLHHAQSTGCLWYDPANADGAVDLGLWVPLGSFGVEEVSLEP